MATTTTGTTRRIPGRRVLGWLPALLVVGTLAAGCSSPDPYQNLPQGGVDATSGAIVVTDLWAQGPQGLTEGADAPMRLTLTNESPTVADALVGVSTPIAEHTALVSAGKPVKTIAIPAGAQVDLESRTGVVLEHVLRNLRAGEWFPITLTFANAGPVTTQACAGPLAATP
jgi:copper(I)-binding protein